MGDRTPQPLRVVHVVGNLNEGGAETLVRNLSVRTADEQTEVSVVCVYPSRLSEDQKKRLGIRVIEIGRRGRSDVGALWRTVRALRSLRPHIVHAHVHTGKYLGRLAALLAGGCKIVFTEHHSDPESGPLHALCDRFLNGRTDAVVTFSEAMRKIVERSPGLDRRRIVVIPNGVPLERTGGRRRDAIRGELGLRDDEKAVLIAARLVPLKNHRLAIAALALLGTRSTMKIKLLFAGDGPEEAGLRKIAREHNLDEDVVFLGFRNDVPRLLEGVDLAASTSLNEAMPISLIEAMAAGVPVVTTPWVGAHEFFQDGRCAEIASDWSADAFARSIERVLTQTEMTAARVAAARDLVYERYDITATAQAHRLLYRSLVGRPSRFAQSANGIGTEARGVL